MLDRYTYIRDELKTRDDLLEGATHYTIMQEEVICELRTFVEDEITDKIAIDEVRKKERKKTKRKYYASKGCLGKPSVDRLIS